jgi:hypothetical protein
LAFKIYTDIKALCFNIEGASILILAGQARAGLQHFQAAVQLRWYSVLIAVRISLVDDKCANPRNLFWAFHAPHPSKNAQIEYIYKNIIKKYIFQNFTNFKINIRIFITYNYTFYKSIKYL